MIRKTNKQRKESRDKTEDFLIDVLKVCLVILSVVGVMLVFLG
jgi:hypothetical protein